MPTTSSPWASPSSPAGRRLLLTEPATLDAVPVLDDATFAALARSAAAPAHPSAVAARLTVDRRAARRVARRVALGAAAVVALLVLAAPSAPRTEPAVAAADRPPSVAPVGLGRVMGEAVVATPPPAAGGEVVVALVDPTDTLRATPGAAPTSSLAGRLGAAVVLAAG